MNKTELLEQLEYLHSIHSNARDNIQRAQDSGRTAAHIVALVTSLDQLIDKLVVELYNLRNPE
jgi:hypothetical protein